MKYILLIAVALSSVGSLYAQNNQEVARYYWEAKAQLENMLAGKETPDFEKAIYIIENAWYDNNIIWDNFNSAISQKVSIINAMAQSAYDESVYLKNENSLYHGINAKVNYENALKNWAIYTYMTNPILMDDKYFHQSYKYSNLDPMGTNDFRNTQVVNLNNNYSGNCFAMAAMFKILANRLNSDAELCTAPSHIYISHKDERGTSFNVEIGSRQFPGTGTMATVTHSTMQGIKNDIALRKLNDKQSVALCLVYLAKGYEHKFGNKDNNFMKQCADIALQYDGLCLNAMLLKSELLEENMIKSGTPFNQLKTQTAFKEYEALLVKLFDLGYREMPLQMKNQLLKGWTRDTVSRLANDRYAKAKTAKEIFYSREASLSWGMFDEKMQDKPVERYGNTLFDSKTKKIKGFAKEQNLYNHYNFDPVVFAWNIDPLTHKFPYHSPYSAFANNPIIFIDEDGREFDFSKMSRTEKQSYDATIKRLSKSEIFRIYYKQLEQSKTVYSVSYDSKLGKGGRYSGKDKSVVLSSDNSYITAQELFHAYQDDGKFYSDRKASHAVIETEGDLVSSYVCREAGLPMPGTPKWAAEMEDKYGQGIDPPSNEEVQSKEYDIEFSKAVDQRIEYYKQKGKDENTDFYKGYSTPNDGEKPKALKEIYIKIETQKDTNDGN